MPNNQHDNQSVLVSKAETISAKLFEQIWNKAHEHYSLKYNAKEVEKIKELSRIYKFCGLSDRPPESWKVENGLPKYVAVTQNWFMLVEEWESKCGSKVSYKELIINIASVCANYLDVRQKRVIASGKHGDSVSQFFSEIMHFAMTLLMSYTAKEMTDVLQKRIHYLDMVLKSPKVIRYGALTRKSNKVDAVTEINRLFKLCLNKAKDEINLESARENIQSVKHSIESVLNDVARIVYYAREDTTASTFVLDKHLFVNIAYSSQIESNRSKWFDQLKETATGQLLLEFIALSGSKSFGYSEKDEFREVGCVYFDFNQDGALRTLHQYLDFVRAHPLDLPAWIGDINDKTRYIQNLIFIIESGIRLSFLHQCICDAHILAGHGGDLWAYGDGDGKYLLNQLIGMITDEQNHLRSLVIDFDKNNETQINDYNEKYRWSYDKKWNPNFRKVHRASVNIGSRLSELVVHLNSLTVGMEAFPNSFGKIKYLKDKFSRTVKKIHHLYYSKEPAGFTQGLLEYQVRDDRRSYLASGDINHFIRLYDESKQHVIKNKSWYHFSWTLNGKANSHFINRREYAITPKLTEVLDRLNGTSSKVTAYESLISINELIAIYADSIEHFGKLRPKWRFNIVKLQFSLGWPFGQSRKRLVEESILINQNIMIKLIDQILYNFNDSKQFSYYQSSSDLLIHTLNLLKEVMSCKNNEIKVFEDKLRYKDPLVLVPIDLESDKELMPKQDGALVTQAVSENPLPLPKYTDLSPCLLFGVFSIAPNLLETPLFPDLFSRCEDLLENCISCCLDVEKFDGLAESYLHDYFECYQMLINARLQDDTLIVYDQLERFNLNMEKLVSGCIKTNLKSPHETRAMLIDAYNENHFLFSNRLDSITLIV